jgi:hypothetical protein
MRAVMADEGREERRSDRPTLPTIDALERDRVLIQSAVYEIIAYGSTVEIDMLLKEAERIAKMVRGRLRR